MRILYALAIILGAAAPCFAAEEADELVKRDRATLLRFQIQPTADGIRRFLEPPALTISQQVSIGAWIEELGSPKFNTRRLATRDLINAGPLVLPYVRKVASHTDPEVRLRANYIINTFRQRGLDREAAVMASLRTIEREKYSSFTPLLLELLPEMEDDAEWFAATRAMNAIVQPEHAPLLVSAIQHRTSPKIRALAVQLLEKAAGAKALPELRKLIDHRDEHLRLAALEAISRRTPRECLPGLIEMLESEDTGIRARSALVLRNTTGEHHQFVAYGYKLQRAAAVKRWKAWLAEDAAAAQLQPLETHTALHRGRILLCLTQPARVIELNEAGKQTLSTDAAKAPCGAAGLPDGRRIIADWDAKAVITLNETGQVVARFPVPGNPNCLSMLPNGNILVGLFDKQLVYEMNANGKFVWQAQVGRGPTAVQRLPSGATLVAMAAGDRVIEIDRNGKETWSVRCRGPESARRLRNGNTLVASGRGIVYEYNRDGDVVWQSHALNWPYDALELENGNLLIGCRDGLIERDRKHNVIRKINLGWVRRVAVY